MDSEDNKRKDVKNIFTTLKLELTISIEESKDFINLLDTAQDMRDEFGEDTAYRYDERYPDRWYRKNMDREYRGGRYDYKRY